MRNTGMVPWEPSWVHCFLTSLEGHWTKAALEPPWKGPYQVVMTTDTAVKLEALCTHLTAKEGFTWHLYKLWRPPNQMIRKRSSWHQGRLILPKILGQIFILSLNTKPFLVFLSFILALTWKNNAIICISQGIAGGGGRGNLWNLA